MNIPKTGQGGSVGMMVTKTLVVVGDPQLTTPPGRARGAMLRAYNKQTGEQVGEVLMPAPQQRLADDVFRRWAAVNHRGRRRRQLHRRIHRFRVAAKRDPPGYRDSRNRVGLMAGL